jgi:phosphate-selective porin OprO/OprP
VLLAGPALADESPALVKRIPQTDGQVTLPAAELERLYHRLDATESRLHQLETRRLPPVAETRILRASETIVPAESPLDERVEALEAQLQKQSEAAAKKKSDDAKKPTQKWTGRIHADYWAFPDTSPGANAFETGDADNSVDDRFLFRRVRFGLQGEIPDLMLYKAEFDLNNPDRPQFKDAYIGWSELPYLHTVLLGNQKRPYGLDHLNSSRYNVFIERPYIVEGFNQDARRFGLASYGVSDDESYSWRYGGYMSQDLQNTGTASATPVLEDYQAEFAGRFANTIWYDEASDGRGYAHWALSGTVGSSDPSGNANSVARWQTRPEARTSSRWLDTGVIVGADTYQMMGAEGLLNLGPFQVCGEYMHMLMQREAAGELNFGGGYVYVSYFLTGEHMTWERSSNTLGRVKPHQNFFWVRDCDGCQQRGCGAWQVAVRYSTADFTDDDVAGGEGNSVTFGLNWHWNAYAKMQFNYIYGDIDNRRPADGQTEGNYSIIGTRFMVDF